LEISVPGVLEVPFANFSLSLELLEKSETSGEAESVYNIVMGCLDWHRLSGSLHLRNWRAGDRYEPVGASGWQKLKTLFQQARIPVWERRTWPVLVDGDAIVWARRFGPATGFAAGAGTGTILRIREVAA